MLENRIKEVQPDYAGAEHITASSPSTIRRWPQGLILCTLGLVACFLLLITPLIRIPDSVVTLHLPPGTLLAHLGDWIPNKLGGLHATKSAYAEIFAFLGLAFLFYGFGALLVRRQPVTDNQRTLRVIVWLGALAVGTITLMTPAMLSHDILVYASYSRVLAVYHANPYFVPISAFPHDPFAVSNYWSNVVSAYGPIWMLVCGLFGSLLHASPDAYTIAFRCFALLSDLLNIWLVGRTLQIMGRSARTVTLGMLLYAWNPLLLVESGLGGHNDSFMVTFVLVAVLLAASAEKRGQMLRVTGYLPATIALTLAALVKFTALPILAAYLLFLACKALRPTAESPRAWRLALRNWRAARPVLAWSGLSALLVALAFYGPFWLGHSPQAIVDSFRNTPSSLYAENSFMRSIGEWQLYHKTLHSALLDFLGSRHFWDDLTIAGILLCLLLGTIRLWHKPTTRTFVVIALSTMSVILLITPWFFSWYITWLLGLSVVCLPVRLNRIEAALLAFVYTFSFSALSIYLFDGSVFGSRYYLVSLFTTIPPICAFLLTMVLWEPVHTDRTGAKKR